MKDFKGQRRNDISNLILGLNGISTKCISLAPAVAIRLSYYDQGA